jgi:hypothetical protein
MMIEIGILIGDNAEQTKTLRDMIVEIKICDKSKMLTQTIKATLELADHDQR